MKSRALILAAARNLVAGLSGETPPNLVTLPSDNIDIYYE